MSQIGYKPSRRERTTVAWNGTGDKPEPLVKAQTSSLAPPANDELEAKDGTVVIIDDEGNVYFEPKAPAVRRDRSKDRFDANLAEELSDGSMSMIAQDYLDGVESDIMSRSGFIANLNKGIDLLGLKIEDASSTRGSRQSISRVKHPALFKACVRSQSNARGQLLPATGPVKVQTIGDSDEQEDNLAKDLQDDFNYYLTKVAREYVPDTDRMLFARAFGGSAFKKVYRCPLRRRPVSETTSIESMIVNEDASDLHSAVRKTQESIVSPTMMKRMQLMGGWRDIPLGTPQIPTNQARRKILESQGFASQSMRPQDMDFTVYEGYWHIDPRDYGFEEPNAPEGLPLPYRVTLDKDSRQVLALHRNWKKADEEFFNERQVFVKYGLVPGLGFLDYGFLHLIGNQTRVLTAAWQIMVDNGMIKNFPAGMKVKGVRTATNEINPGLGEWAEVDIGSKDDIRKALMAMPYGDLSPAFIELMKGIEEDAEAMSGTIEMETGSGRTNVPVGTILAMIEQQSQDLTAVHQRDHRSQEEELLLLRDLFVENPGDLRWLKGKRSKRDWPTLLQEFTDADISPASDPNVPSQTHRIMLNMFLMQIAQSAPMLFGSKLRNLAKRIMLSVGISDADSLLASPQEIQQTQATMQQQGQQGKGGNNGAGAASIAKAQMELPLKQQEMGLEERKLQLKEQENERQAANEAQEHAQRAEDQRLREQDDATKLQLDRSKLQSEHVRGLATAVLGNADNQAQRQHDAFQADADREHEAAIADQDRQHQAREGAANRTAGERKLRTQNRQRKKTAKPGSGK